jgi:hypothetical protein
MGTIDLPHAARTQRGKDFIRAGASAGRQRHGYGPKILGWPATTDTLWDAYENRIVSVCTNRIQAKQASAFCSTTETFDQEAAVDCAKCRAFIKERMTN